MSTQRHRKTICSWTRFAANLFFERPENKEIYRDIALLVIDILDSDSIHYTVDRWRRPFTTWNQWCFAAGICFRICHEIEKDHLPNWQILWLVLYIKVATSAIKCPKYTITSPSCFQHLLTLQEIISGIWAPSSMQSHHIKGLQIQLKTGYPFGTDVEYWIQNQEPFVPLPEANCLVDVFFCCYWWIVLVGVVSILVAGANCGLMTSNNPSPNLIANDTSLRGILQDCDLVRLVNELYYCILHTVSMR